MIADSLSGVHIPLPAVRPRQRSWGTSLPQSVILQFLFIHYATLRCLFFRSLPGASLPSRLPHMVRRTFEPPTWLRSVVLTTGG